MIQMERPLIVITFQGILGDFFKDGGVSMKQDQIMTKQYIKDFENKDKDNDAPNYHMWARLGSIDGLRYLSKHFQIVIFNRDTCIEELGKNFS